MRSNHSFRSRTTTTSIPNLKRQTRKKRSKLLHLPKHTPSAAVSTARTAPSATARRRLRDLQKLVPGQSHETDLNHLFQRTADHIFALQLKLNILKDLTSFYGI